MHFASPEESTGAQELLLTTVARTNSKYECQDCRVITNAQDPTRIQYVEKWDSEAEFISHARSNEFLRVLNAIDLCSEMPEVKVERLFTDSGLDCFKQILHQATG